MVRIIGIAIVGAVLGGIVTGGSSVGVWGGLLLFGAGAVVPLLTGVSALRCPFCRKRVKLGATHCSHCAHPVGRRLTR